MSNNYQTIPTSSKVKIKAWVNGVHFEQQAQQQLHAIAKLDFIHKHIAVMPDVHLGIGATIGSVIPSVKAIIPAAVGVDIGCGMVAVKTSLKASQLPDNLHSIRTALEHAIPHGHSRGRRDKGAWGNIPKHVQKKWLDLDTRFETICQKHPMIAQSNHINHLGTLGGGNHFVELCLDEEDNVWVMLHSGSRGVGNRIGNYFIECAKKDMERHAIHLPDKNLAYLKEGSEHFDDYVFAVSWAQDFALTNREIMLENALRALSQEIIIPFTVTEEAVNCHHNYVSKEFHFGKEVYVTRKGAVSAKQDELGIIPGSMGAKSFIVRGLGNPESFQSCSHGAGRMMSRNQAKKQFSVAEHIQATKGVECRKDKAVIDETPMAYKDIDKVMEAQSDLVEVVHTLKQIVCVKG